MANTKISALTAATTPLAGTEVLPIVQSSATVKVSVNNLTAGKTVPANAIVVGGGTLSSWGSNSPVEVGSNGMAIAQQSSGSGLVVWNLYQNSGGSFVYKTSNPGLLYQLGSDGVYRWYTAPSGTAGNTASLSLQASIDSGNYVPATAAKGINFTANSAAAGKTSQLLNWYEEGTWTPSDSSGAGLSFTSVTGVYTRVGRLVTCTFGLTFPATASAAGVTIGGLPFTSLTGGPPNPSGGSITYTGAAVSAAGFAVGSGATTVALYGASGTALTNAAFSGSILRAQFTYTAN